MSGFGHREGSLFGISRNEIEWHSTIDPELCMGCGICVVRCGRGVLRFDYEKNVAVVAYPPGTAQLDVRGVKTCVQDVRSASRQHHIYTD